MSKCVANVSEGSQDDSIGGVVGHVDFRWEPRDSIADAGRSSVIDPDAIAAIGVHRWADVPAIKAMGGPGLAGRRFFVGNDTAAWGSEGCAVVVKLATYLCMGGELGVEAGCSHHVQCDLGLWNELVPKVDWEILISAAESGDEVVLECADGSFGRVTTVHAGWH